MSVNIRLLTLTVQSQLAIDLNCNPDDFNKEGLIFCESKVNPGRRPFPREERHLDILTMGKAIIVSATPDIMPNIQEQLQGKSRDEAFAMPFVYTTAHYYLPTDIKPLQKPTDYDYEFVEGTDIHKLYVYKEFENCMQYDINHPRPDVLILTAKKDGKIIAMAGASADGEDMWQIGIDVLPEHRQTGLAAYLTSCLAIEILARGKVPYYCTSSSNIASQRVAFRSGFSPAWVCTYKTLI